MLINQANENQASGFVPLGNHLFYNLCLHGDQLTTRVEASLLSASLLIEGQRATAYSCAKNVKSAAQLYYNLSLYPRVSALLSSIVLMTS